MAGTNTNPATVESLSGRIDAIVLELYDLQRARRIAAPLLGELANVDPYPSSDGEALIWSAAQSKWVAGGRGVPVGGIIIWSGTVASIPVGYALCNGSSGTPDLRDRFVVGAGTTYAVSATGGAATVALTSAELAAHTHTGPAHVHNQNVSAADATGSGTLRADYVADSTTAGVYSQGVNTDSAGTGASGSTGSGTAHQNLPPYYALAYIQRLS